MAWCCGVVYDGIGYNLYGVEEQYFERERTIYPYRTGGYNVSWYQLGGFYSILVGPTNALLTTVYGHCLYGLSDGELASVRLLGPVYIAGHLGKREAVNYVWCMVLAWL